MRIFFFIFYAIIFLVIAFIDWKKHVIPNIIVFPGMISAFILNWLFMPIGWDYSLLGLFIALAFAVSFYYLTKMKGGTQLGYGDIKLILFSGIVLGFPAVIWSLIGSTLVAGVTGLLLLVFGRKKLSQKLPFGTFLGAGSAVTLLVIEVNIWGL